MVLYSMKLKKLPNQSSLVTIALDDQTRVFRLDISYKEICGYWLMSITDHKTNEEILANIPLVTGQSLGGAGNLLAQFGYKNLGRIGIAPITEQTTDIPSKVNIDTDFIMIWEKD